MTIEIDHYNGIDIEEYNGVYGLISMYKGGGEEMSVWYKRWCFPSKWKNGRAVPDEKSKPVAVRIGHGQKETLETLKQIVEEFTHGQMEIKPK